MRVQQSRGVKGTLMFFSIVASLVCQIGACSFVDDTPTVEARENSMSSAIVDVSSPTVLSGSTGSDVANATFAAATGGQSLGLNSEQGIVADPAVGSGSSAPLLAASSTPVPAVSIPAILTSQTINKPKGTILDSENFILFSNPTTTALTNHPIQFGRSFVAGEIPLCPGVLVDGVTTQFQVAVKNRWPDGSVKFAVIASIVPKIAAAGSVRFNFTNQDCTSNVGPSSTSVLAKYPNLDAVTILNGGVSGTVSLRTMLQQNKFTHWIDGPIASTYIIADHVGRQFDVGPDSFKSVRPVFHLTVWHTIGRAHVRFIGEQTDTLKMQNQRYSLELRGGVDAQKTLYQQSEVSQTYASRWTKSFWLNGQHTELGANYSLKYISKSRALPNYDSTIRIEAYQRDRRLASWNAMTSDKKALFGGGSYQKWMPTAGGRMDIGLLTEWASLALFDGDARLWAMWKENTDQSGSWPMHFRGGDPTRNFMNYPKVVSEVGMPITKDGHRKMYLYDGNGYLGNWPHLNGQDEPKIVGVKDHQGWYPDCAHQPDDHFPLYILTGDYWYLEQLQFWAAWAVFDANTIYDVPGQKPEDAWFDNQIRGEAWCLRTRARAAWASVDGSNESIYFNRILDSTLRVFEGMKIGKDGKGGTRDWWANYSAKQSNPLRYWKFNATANPQQQERLAPWTVWFMISVLGHVQELGYSSGELLAWLAPFQLNMVNTPGFNPKHMADYQFPIRKNYGDYSVYQDLMLLHNDWTDWTSLWDAQVDDLDHGYPAISSASMSFLKNQPGGEFGWQWMNTNYYSKARWFVNAKWAIIPRQ